MVFADRSRNDSEDLTGTRDDDGSIFRIRGNEREDSIFFLEILERHVSIKGSDDDVIILWCTRSVEDDDISLDDPGTLHTVSLDSNEIGRCRMLDEVGFEIHGTDGLCLWREGKSSSHRLEKWILDEGSSGDIVLPIEFEHSLYTESFEKELHSRPIGIAEE